MTEPTADTTDPPEPAAEVPTSRAGRDLGAAIGVGVGLGAAVIATLVFYRPGFAILVGIAVLISLWELVTAMETGPTRPPLIPLMLGAVSMLTLAYLRDTEGLIVGFMLTVLGCLIWRLAEGPGGYLRDASATVLIATYVPLLASFAVLLSVPDDGSARVVAFIATVVSSDVGGYIAGVLFGKHPMAPTVSPKKSWEGFAGSVAGCVLTGSITVTVGVGGTLWQGALFGVAIAATATLGDLGESLLKRDLGIKDMGSLLPGHGGLMDRMDSLLPAAAVAWVLLSAFVPVVVT